MRKLLTVSALILMTGTAQAEDLDLACHIYKKVVDHRPSPAVNSDSEYAVQSYDEDGTEYYNVKIRGDIATVEIEGGDRNIPSAEFAVSSNKDTINIGHAGVSRTDGREFAIAHHLEIDRQTGKFNYLIRIKDATDIWQSGTCRAGAKAS